MPEEFSGIFYVVAFIKQNFPNVHQKDVAGIFNPVLTDSPLFVRTE